MQPDLPPADNSTRDLGTRQFDSNDSTRDLTQDAQPGSSTQVLNTSNPDAPAEFTDLTGQVIKGYEIRQLIGQGGFGAVYKAYQPTVERDVAIKVILPEYANNPHFIKRFESEAQVIARLEHLHIVPLYDYWRDADMACLVMRWLRGGSLQDAIDQNGPWQLLATANLLDQVASALTVAHNRGVVHRDLKPANILLDDEKNGYLADFGIAKILGPAPQEVTEEDRYGSPAYISPEQVMGDPVSPQTDIYSLGVVLYMLLTGRTPFLDPSTTTIIKRHLNEPLPPVQTSRPDVPHAVNLIIWKATSKRPEARYTSAMSLAAEFRQIISSEKSPSELVEIVSTPQPANMTLPPGGRTIIVEPSMEPDNPYKGLRAFQEADAGDFFGRDSLIRHLVDRFKDESPFARFLAIVGPSGSGKSSVARAGLLPTLRRGALTGSQDWFYLQIIPGANPLRELTDALLKIAIQPPENLYESIRSDENGLLKAVEQILPFEEDELILLIDQFEEVFTQTTNEAERAHFLKLLQSAVTDPKSRTRLIITLRADLYDRPLFYPGFSELISRRTETILPLSQEEIEQAIVGPAQRLQMRFEPGLVSEIIEDVKQQPGALPLLQYALTELFERRNGFILTRAAYQQTGGVLGALATRADELYQEMDSASQAAARQLFLRLVTLGEGVEDTRRRVLRSELNSIATLKHISQEVVETYGKHRLLTFDYEQGTRAPTVEIAHEALIRIWPRLREWLNESRNDLRVHRRLSEASSEWNNANRENSYLATGSRLAQFETLALSPTLALNENESSYLWASVAAKQRSATRLRWIMIGLGIFSLVALALAVFAFDRQSAAESEKIRADDQARISRSRELAVTALTGVNQPDLALLLSLESLNAADTFEARNSLLTSLQTSPRLTKVLSGHTSGVRAVTYSPDGKVLASAGSDNNIILWDTSTNQEIGVPLSGHTDWINSLAFSSDNRILASASSDGTVRLWDATTGQPIGQPLSLAESLDDDIDMWSVAISPDGQVVAAGDTSGAINLWNIQTGTSVGEPLIGHEDTVYSLAFSPDGTMLASGSGDSTVRLWDTSTYQEMVEPFAEHQGNVLAVAFSPDGSQVISSGVDRNIIFWYLPPDEGSFSISSGHTQRIKGLAYSPDGRFIASGSDDGTIRLWDVSSGEMIGQPLTGHNDKVWSVAFSPDSHTLASGSEDQSVLLWNTETENNLGQALENNGGNVLSVAYSPDGTQFASAGGNVQGNGEGADNTIHIWDAATRDQIADLSGHTHYISGIAYSPDGKSIASASADGTLRIWDIASSETRLNLQLPVFTLFSLPAYSPDGKILATGGFEGGITLWNTETGDILISQLPDSAADQVQALAFSRDGKILASGGDDNKVSLWDVASGKLIGAPLAGHTDYINAISFSPDGKTLASAGRDYTIILWDISTGQRVAQWIAPKKEITALAFSPDGKILASGTYGLSDFKVVLWDVAQGEQLGRPLVGHSDIVMSLAFSPDGQHLVSGAQDGLVFQWDTSFNSWKNRACSIANRNLTHEEWDRFFKGLDYQATCPTLPIPST